MAKKALVLGSNGYVTKLVGTDIISEMTSNEGWGNDPAIKFEIYVKNVEGNNLEISINEATSFTLLAGDELEVVGESVHSCKILTADVEFRYLARF